MGAGTVGMSISRYLAREGHDVTIIDMKRQRLQVAEDELDVQTIQGNACDPAKLEELDIESIDVMLAVTERDETNLISCFAAKQMGARRVVARVRSQFFYHDSVVNFRSKFEIDLFISPEVDTAIELLNFVSMPSALSVVSLAQGRVQLRTIKVAEGSEFCGRELRDLTIPQGALIAGLRRGEHVQIARGNTTIQPEDRVTVIGLPHVLDDITHRLSHEKVGGEISSVVVAGAGETGLFLARMLERRGHRVILIEADRERAEYVSSQVDKATVLNGDATEVNFLREELIGKSDYFIATTGDDENNIMSAMLAKELGVRRTACLIERPDYTRIVERMGVDIAISPRFVAANKVLAMVKRGRIRSVTLMDDGELEINEYVTLSSSRLVGEMLKDLDMPEDTLIGAVVQGGKVHIPRGDFIIRPGDTVITIARPEAAEELDDAFASQTRRP